LLCLAFLCLEAVVAQSCSGDGGTGTCVDTNSNPCTNGVLVPDQCPGPNNIVCCVTNWGSCNVNGQQGTCEMNTACGGTVVPGYCPGPNNVECCLSSGPTPGWNRTMCEKVASLWNWFHIQYNWSPTTDQFVLSGPGLYRSDCSGFVSAAWNFPPPGYVVDDMPCYPISASQLSRCDALQHMGQGGDGHIALFWGWDGSNPIVMEECGHFSDCCGNQATCPGSCGSSTSCNEYCPGCPIQLRSWSGGLQGFQPVRRNGW